MILTLTDKDGGTFKIDSDLISAIICDSPESRRIETLTGDTIYILEDITDVLRGIYGVKSYE